MSVAVKLLLVGAGSAIGGMARYGVALAAARWLGAAFPYGTLLVNVAGCFLIALIGSAGAHKAALETEAVLLFAVIGVLGGFTTYSSFNEQTLLLLREGKAIAAAANVLLTLLGCALAGVLGFVAGKLAAP